MKAYQYLGEKNFSFQDVAIPKAGVNEAVAKVKCATICGTDLRLYRFGSEELDFPITIGHEACYEIVETGENADLKIGGRYIMAPAIGCGKCKSCNKGKSNMCDDLMTMGFQYSGTFAEFVKIPSRAIERGHLIEIVGDIPDEYVSAVEPVACAINGQSYLDIQPGENVLIYGGGYLGCIHAELAFLKGASNVIVAEITEKRRKKVKAFVPNVSVVDSTESSYVEAVRAIVGEAGVDVVIVACPAGIAQKQGLELLSKNGRLSLFGGLPGNDNFYLDSNLIHYKEISVYGAHASTVNQNKEALSLVQSGKINIGKYITKFDFKDVDKAFQALINEEVEKAALIP